MDKDKAIKVFNELLKELKMNPKQLSDSLGKERPQWAYDILNENKNVGISKNAAKLICSKYPQINESWLLTGEGSMLTSYHQDQENIIEITADDIREDIFIGTPVYDIDGTCGTDERDMQFANDSIIGSVNLPGISKSAKIITANGDSMEPVVHDGSRVVLREIFGWDDIFYGQIYLILMEEYRMIKYIRRYEKDEENYIILRSENPKYDDMKIHKDKIKKLFIVENILSVKNQI